ncbi:40S ribosomal protein S30 [Exophiala spinifera]|uniref:40S ribosomal protein S30 n=1 Tax=Exophiala spinifera TaxID=91928 RepID=A0A0D1ZHT4_9EURO|nr:40S ribosomal protein S30 [Exophiala spinifera]KIW12462.1 40S ribosomal protein S30 [Exophiala spinifera]
MGKVHGSLARAGKVKSQTPKVEPQEKKKTPKGRAKKRITYTRRFVNVTMTGGKRKVGHVAFNRIAARKIYTDAYQKFADEP